MSGFINIYADEQKCVLSYKRLRAQKTYLKRGTNEYTNGLIRQFLPKSMPLDKVSADDVKAIEDNLNNRPRKILGYRTPLEVKSGFGGVVLRY